MKSTKQMSWMASPARVMPQPSRIWPWSGVPLDWEDAQMEMPMACTLCGVTERGVDGWVGERWVGEWGRWAGRQQRSHPMAGGSSCSARGRPQRGGAGLGRRMPRHGAGAVRRNYSCARAAAAGDYNTSTTGRSLLSPLLT